jgi:hypothetical protein
MKDKCDGIGVLDRKAPTTEPVELKEVHIDLPPMTLPAIFEVSEEGDSSVASD